jgi:hypothetical protein
MRLTRAFWLLLAFAVVTTIGWAFASIMAGR